MPKSSAGLIAAIALSPSLPGASVGAAILGPHAAVCASGGPAMLVKVEGLKARTGVVRVQSYGGDPAHYFDKGTYLERVEVRPPASGPLDVCMPVPRAGTYAVSVRHDVAGDRKAGMNDGGGMSGNPNLSLMDVLFKRRPAPSEVAVAVRGVTPVAIIMNYVHGASVGPVASAER